MVWPGAGLSRRIDVDCHWWQLGGKMTKKSKPHWPETHQRGYLTIEQTLPKHLADCDFGVQIAPDGRVWICIDGKAFLRFHPTL